MNLNKPTCHVLQALKNTFVYNHCTTTFVTKAFYLVSALPLSPLLLSLLLLPLRNFSIWVRFCQQLHNMCIAAAFSQKIRAFSSSRGREDTWSRRRANASWVQFFSFFFFSLYFFFANFCCVAEEVLPPLPLKGAPYIRMVKYGEAATTGNKCRFFDGFGFFMKSVISATTSCLNLRNFAKEEELC